MNTFDVIAYRCMILFVINYGRLCLYVLLVYKLMHLCGASVVLVWNVLCRGCQSFPIFSSVLQVCDALWELYLCNSLTFLGFFALFVWSVSLFSWSVIFLHAFLLSLRIFSTRFRLWYKYIVPALLCAWPVMSGCLIDERPCGWISLDGTTVTIFSLATNIFSSLCICVFLVFYCYFLIPQDILYIYK